MASVRKTALIAAQACALLCVAAPAAALESSVVAADREVSLSALVLHRSYAEHFPAGAVGADRESGPAPGLSASASWVGQAGPVSDLSASATAEFSRGNPTFRGTLFNSTQPVQFQTALTDWSVLAQLGKAFTTGRFVVTPLVEAGYRSWSRDLGPAQVEDYRTSFVGVGLRSEILAGSQWLVRAEAGAATTLSPRIAFHYLNSYQAPLGRRGLYTVALGLDRRLAGRVHFVLRGQAQWYGFGQSPPVQTAERGLIFEPSSRTTDLRLSSGLAYAF